MQETNVNVKEIPKLVQQNYDNGNKNPPTLRWLSNPLFIISAMCIWKFEIK